MNIRMHRMESGEKRDEITATANNPDAAMDAAITYCRYTGGAPLRVYVDGEPWAVVTTAVVEDESEFEGLGA